MNEETIFYDELRDIQINLKREDTFYTFFRTETRELNHQIKFLFLSALYRHKKLGMIHMEAMLNKDITAHPSYVSSFYTQEPSRIPNVPHDISETMISQIQKEISKFSNDFSYLAQCCQRLYQTKNEILLYTLTFSTIQSIFGNLLFKESTDNYLSFMKLIIKEHYHLSTFLAQALYIHPLFIDFLNEVISNLDIKSEKYFIEFQKSWKKNAKYCPLPIIEMISYSDNPGDFLFRSLFEPICKSMHAFGAAPLIPNIELPSTEKFSKGFKKISNNLWTQLVSEKDNSTLLQSSQEIEDYIPDFGKALLLSPFDIDVLISMCSSSITMKNPFKTDSFSVFLFTMPKQRNYYFSDINLMEDISFLDDAEGKLREILINIDNVLVFSSKSQPKIKVNLSLDQYQNLMPNDSSNQELDLYNFLNDQLTFMPNKTLLKLKLNHLKPLLQKALSESHDSVEKKDIEFFNEILKKGFDNRQKERESCLKDMAYMNQIIFSLESISNQISDDLKYQKNILTFYLIEEWSKTFTPPINSPDEWNKLYVNDESFRDFFQTCFKNCETWCKVNQYRITKFDISECLFNSVMAFFSFNKYISLSNDLAIKDAKNCQRINEIMKDGKIEFIPMANQLIGDDVQKKLKPIIRVFRSADMTDQPLIKIDNFLQAQYMLFNLLQFVGVSEIGADQLEPCLFLLFSMANLPHLETTINYINHFTSPLIDFGSFPTALPFERLKSSITGFFQLIDEKSNK